MTDPLWEALRRQHLEETHRASGSCPGWTCPTAQVLAALTQPAAPAEGLKPTLPPPDPRLVGTEYRPLFPAAPAERPASVRASLEEQYQPAAPAEGLDVERLRNATRKAGGWVPEDDEGRATEQEWLDEVAREYAALTPEDDHD